MKLHYRIGMDWWALLLFAAMLLPIRPCATLTEGTRTKNRRKRLKNKINNNLLR